MRRISASQVIIPSLLIASVGVLAGASPASEPVAAEPAVELVPLALAPTAASPEAAPVTMGSEPMDARDEVDEATDAALKALAPRVRRTSHSDALRTAFHAYFSYRAEHPDAVRKPYLYFVDLGLDNQTRRGYVFDMDRLDLVEGPFTVAHGTGSSRTRNTVPESFSNRPGSRMSSLGLYLAQETYSFSGKSGGRRYSSVGLRMRGESGQFNSAARARGIVAHGAPYVTAGQAGRSEGCPAMEMDRAQRLLPLIANGGVVFIYSPNDNRWLERDPWINAD